MREAEASNMLPADEELFAQGDLKEVEFDPCRHAGGRAHSDHVGLNRHFVLCRQRPRLRVVTRH